MATPAEYRTVAHLFEVARSTVCETVHETCQAIVTVLREKYVRFPSSDSLDAIVDGFQTKWGVPQCVGAVDGSHIPIYGPKENHTDYYNRKGYYSIVLQGLVDHRYCFLDVYIGWPGSVHDARVFAHSSLYSQLSKGELLPHNKTITYNRTDIPLFILGDSAYPLETWLIKPFSQNAAATPQQRNYNYRISRARIVVENAYGRLKARWRRLLKRNDMHLNNIPVVVTVACVLHNICEIDGDTFNDSWLSEELSGSNFPQPSTIAHHTILGNRAKQTRDTLVQYFTTH